MRKLGIILLVVMGLLMLSGCGKAPVVPFEQNPDTFVSENIQKDIDNADTLREMYKHYMVNKWMGTETDAFNAFYKNLSEDEKNIFILRGGMIDFLDTHYNDKEDEFDKYLLEITKDYLNTTKLNSSNLEVDMSKYLIEKNPVATVKKYMSDNKIIVNNLQLPDAFVSVDRWNYPMSGTYKYIVVGEVDGEPFEKEITQTFYFGANLDEIENYQEASLIIEAIK